MMPRTMTLAGVLALLLLGCVTPPPSLPMPTLSVWRGALRRLEMLRRAAAVPRTERIAIELRVPGSGKMLLARGAVAVAPPHGLRMLLLGPGGTTALDLWMNAGRFRWGMPAIGRVQRGLLVAFPAERRGLPVDFLDFWLLHPARGELLWYGIEATGERFVLRDEATMVDLRVHAGGGVQIRRTTWVEGQRADEETVAADRLGCGEARYHQASTGIEVRVACEGETKGEPPSRALADPDGLAP